MKTRTLGHTGMVITVVGVGTGSAGLDPEESLGVVCAAVEHGINWVDTAAVYGRGRCETIVARALEAFPVSDRPYVFTKCGAVWDPADPSTPPRAVAAPASPRREVDDSLRRLRVERIDLYQIHMLPEDGTRLEDYWAAMLELKAAGKIRAAGLSNHDVERLEIAERIGHVDALQPRFSALDRRAAGELAWCADDGTGAMVYSPMHSGLLSGHFSVERVARLDPDDWRSAHSDFHGERLLASLAVADAMRPIAADRNTTVAAVAVAWTLAWGGVTGAIVGARNPDQLAGSLRAAGLELTDTELDPIARAIERTGDGRGPARPTAPRSPNHE